MFQPLIRLMFLLSLVLCVAGQTQLTVYNHGEALVKESFTRTLSSGISEIELEDVAEAMNPASVKLNSAQQLQVLEQNYRYDLVDQNKLLKKYLGAEVTVTLQNDKKLSGELLSYDNVSLVISSKGGTDIVQRGFVGSIKCPTPLERLYVRPTLAWTVKVEQAGKRELELSYLTNNISWRAEYVAIINADDTQMDLSSWINLDNRSGKDYNKAKLKLVAGDLNRPRSALAMQTMETDMVFKGRGVPVVEERNFFEYHLYDIAFPVTVHNREEKQIQWLSPTMVKTQKRYIYDGRGGELSNIPIKLMFTNDKLNGTGVALPAGVVRLFKKDTDGALELAGEDNITHISRDDLVTLEVGRAFDVKGKYEVLDRRSRQDRFREEDVRITLANRKDVALEVDVIQIVGYANWEIIKSTVSAEKLDATRAKFIVPVPANTEVILEYTSRQNLK